MQVRTNSKKRNFNHTNAESLDYYEQRHNFCQITKRRFSRYHVSTPPVISNFKNMPIKVLFKQKAKTTGQNIYPDPAKRTKHQCLVKTSFDKSSSKVDSSTGGRIGRGCSSSCSSRSKSNSGG